MRFAWFWTFWHWSVDAYRAGEVLRPPALAVRGLWDEWYGHEASDDDRRAIADVGRSVTAQRRFAVWLVRRWTRETVWEGERPPARVLLAQLADVAPFDRWPGLQRHRAGYGAPGVSAIVLAEGSDGEASDVHAVTAAAVRTGEPPAHATGSVVAEGFGAASVDLDVVARAARSVLAGRGLATLLALWAVGGRRPYPQAARVALLAGWFGTGALVALLRFGPEPGPSLHAVAAVLVALWSATAAAALGGAVAVGVQAWRAGRLWARRLDASEVRLRMPNGLAVQGASAGLPFCLDTLLALYRAAPEPARGASLWRAILGALHGARGRWAATGALTPSGGVRRVVLGPKLRACVRRGTVTDVLTPWQRDASPRAIRRARDGLSAASDASRGRPSRAADSARAMPLGFAASETTLRGHRCRHVAQALLAVGGLSSAGQVAASAYAVAASALVVAAHGDLAAILRPPRAPMLVTGPASPSQYDLWVSLDTDRPRAFIVELSSDYWAARRAELVGLAAPAVGARATLRLRRQRHATSADLEDGVVSVARRQRFLGRTYAGGEEVGHFTVSYILRGARG